MKEILQKILEHHALTYEEATRIIIAINEGEFNDYQLVAVMTSLQMRGVNIEEMRGFQDALLDFAIPVDLSMYNGIDLCGTGGDGKNTFNISTTTSLVLASMGYKVVKHGNYGVSSICGSSNVLEFLGFPFYTDQKDLEREMDSKNIVFLHAPSFHPVLAKVGKLRKALGVRTFFNSLGPLVNPAKPSFQMTGTYNLELAKIYPFLLFEKRKNFKVTFGLDGYDELTLVDNCKVIGKQDELILNATYFDVENVREESIFGGDTIESAAGILRSILKGKGSKSQNQVIAANVSLAIECIENKKELKVNFERALEEIESGKSAEFFKLN